MFLPISLDLVVTAFHILHALGNLIIKLGFKLFLSQSLGLKFVLLLFKIIFDLVIKELDIVVQFSLFDCCCKFILCWLH